MKTEDFMQYKITKQYAKDTEMPLAEFIDLKDTELFISTKITIDTSKSQTLIYRLYDNDKLLQEYNKEKITIPLARAQYAQDGSDFPHIFAEPFRVFTQYTNENNIIAKFCNIDDARMFIEAKLTTSSLPIKINEIYLIYNGSQFIEKIDQTTIDLQRKQSQDSQGKEKKVAFRPTPLATTLRLGPPKWIVDEEDDDSDKNEK